MIVRFGAADTVSNSDTIPCKCIRSNSYLVHVNVLSRLCAFGWMWPGVQPASPAFISTDGTATMPNAVADAHQSVRRSLASLHARAHERETRIQSFVSEKRRRGDRLADQLSEATRALDGVIRKIDHGPQQSLRAEIWRADERLLAREQARHGWRDEMLRTKEVYLGSERVENAALVDAGEDVMSYWFHTPDSRLGPEISSALPVVHDALGLCS